MKVAVAVVVVIAAVVGGIVLFGGDGSTTTSGPSGSGTPIDPETPELTFKTAKTVAVPVTTAQTPKKLAAAAKGAVQDAVAVMDAVYTEGFLDPNSWDGGDYDDTWTQFAEDAVPKADVDALTAGPDAGEAYTTIEPVKATLRPRVLVDDAGKPVSVVAVVYFTAKGIHDDGSYTLFKSTGQYFLRRDGADWKVMAFDVRRADSEKEAPASPEPSGSSEPSESTS